MSDKKYYAGFDVGGSKLDAVLVAEDGHIVSRILAKGGNPVDLGFDNAKVHYLGIIKELLEKAGDGTVETLYGSVAAVEYYGDALAEWFRANLDVKKIRIEGDGPCLISGMLGHIDGASMICGTGSSLYFRKGEEYSHTGGWGHLIDSCGSGYVLGHLALRAVCRAQDGREQPTLLTELVEKKIGKTVWEDYVRIYSEGRPYIAKFAECVFEARKLGDTVANNIFNLCAKELGDVAFSAYRAMGKPFDMVLNGGIFAHYPEYVEAVKAACPEQINVIMSDVPPVYGCAVEALYDAGINADATTRENFLGDYVKL